MTVASTPRPDFVTAPVAEVEMQLFGVLNSENGVSHGRVPSLGAAGRAGTSLRARILTAGCVAVVVLPEVDSPTHQLVNITPFVALVSWVSSARLVASAAVQAELESHAVDPVGDGFDAVGPFGWVGYEPSRAVTALGGPAVVDVDV